MHSPVASLSTIKKISSFQPSEFSLHAVKRMKEKVNMYGIHDFLIYIFELTWRQIYNISIIPLFISSNIILINQTSEI